MTERTVWTTVVLAAAVIALIVVLLLAYGPETGRHRRARQTNDALQTCLQHKGLARVDHTDEIDAIVICKDGYFIKVSN